MSSQKGKLLGLLKLNAKKNNRSYDDLIGWLETTSFYTDPASQRYHNNYPGGLVDHMLNVNEILEDQIRSSKIKDQFTTDTFDTLIVAIGHDLNKVGTYKIGFRNRKIDNVWCQMKFYEGQYRDDILTHAEVSLALTRKYVPDLSRTECAAIRWAEGMWDESCGTDAGRRAWTNAIKYDPRVLYTHNADMQATYYYEKILDEIELNKVLSKIK